MPLSNWQFCNQKPFTQTRHQITTNSTTNTNSSHSTVPDSRSDQTDNVSELVRFSRALNLPNLNWHVAGQLLPGLDLALQSMSRKERATFIFDSSVMFGELGVSPRIPGDADSMLDLSDFPFDYHDGCFSIRWDRNFWLHREESHWRFLWEDCRKILLPHLESVWRGYGVQDERMLLSLKEMVALVNQCRDVSGAVVIWAVSLMVLMWCYARMPMPLSGTSDTGSLWTSIWELVFCDLATM